MHSTNVQMTKVAPSNAVDPAYAAPFAGKYRENVEHDKYESAFTVSSRSFVYFLQCLLTQANRLEVGKGILRASNLLVLLGRVK